MTDTYTTRVLTALQTLVASDADSATGGPVFESLCVQAVELVEGCDHASLMLLRPSGAYCAAASSDVATAADELETSLQEGPCVDVLDDREPAEHASTDLENSERWPRLAAAMLERTPVRGAAGFRLRVQGRKVGALNLFSERAGALTATSLQQGAIFAALATFWLAAAESEHKAATLQAGLESNRLIGTAVGLVMSSHGLRDDEAFGVLTKLSQDLNEKVGVVAAKVVSQHLSQLGR